MLVSREALILQRATRKHIQQPMSVFEITIYLLKNVIILIFCQPVLFLHTCVSKSAAVSKDAIFYLL